MVRMEIPESSDRRRLRNADLAEQVSLRAEPLPPGDRALLDAAFRDGKTAVEIALLTGEDHRIVRRRIRRLAVRVMSPRYVFVLRERARWPATRRRVGEVCVLRGRSMRAACLELGMSMHMVRRQRELIDALFQATLLTPRTHSEGAA